MVLKRFFHEDETGGFHLQLRRRQKATQHMVHRECGDPVQTLPWPRVQETALGAETWQDKVPQP